jgi:hypothetical protein
VDFSKSYSTKIEAGEPQQVNAEMPGNMV